MNDLMTKSFMSYVELKKQCQMDLEKEKDLEMGNISIEDQNNLSQFFQQVEVIKTNMQEISNLLLDLQSLNDETKSTYSAKILRGIRDRIDSDMVSVLRKAKTVKKHLETLDASNEINRKIYAEGSAVDRTRVLTTNGLRSKLKEIMNGFQTLREKIVTDYKEGLRRRYYNVTGEYPSEETIESMVLGNCTKVEKREDMNNNSNNLENKERHEAVMDIWRSLNRLHQVFLDMALMVETQGERINDIEHNVAIAGSFVSGGTNSLFYAKQAKGEGRKLKCTCLFWLWGVGFVILLVCLVALLAN